MLLVAPSEHVIQKLLNQSDIKWTVSSLPEKHGCDFLSLTPIGIIGFQRKTLPDLAASLIDGRLHYELDQIASSATLTQAYLIVESTLSRTIDGGFVESELSVKSFRSCLVKCQGRGVGYLPSSSPDDTIACIVSVSRYVQGSSFSTTRRPKHLKDSWGTVNSDAYAVFLLQSFPNIGPTQARAILDHFGRVPISWDITVDDLMSVKGIGRKTAQSLIDALRLE